MSKNKAAYWIEKLGLQKHPEGGYYKETYRDTETIETSTGKRSVSTAIYFLLEGNDISAFHRIQSDELWHYHAGGSATIYFIDGKGSLEELKIGPEDDLQVVIPKNCWFGGRLNDKDDFILVSCTVAPGFDFVDFELAVKVDLLEDYPQYGQIIEELAI